MLFIEPLKIELNCIVIVMMTGLNTQFIYDGTIFISGFRTPIDRSEMSGSITNSPLISEMHNCKQRF